MQLDEEVGFCTRDEAAAELPGNPMQPAAEPGRKVGRWQTVVLEMALRFFQSFGLAILSLNAQNLNS